MERWSAGQIELFHALGKICEKIGQEGAAELMRANNGEVNSFNVANTGPFSEELERLRVKAEKVDELQRENRRLKANLEKALTERLSDDSTRVGNEKHGTGLIDKEHRVTKRPREDTNRTLGRTLHGDEEREINTAVKEDDSSKSRSLGGHVAHDSFVARYMEHTSHEYLMQKHTTLMEGHKQLLLARDQLENKLRSSQKSAKEWFEYAKALEKRIGRLEKKLTHHGIAIKRHSDVANTTANGLTSNGDLPPILNAQSEPQQKREESHGAVLRMSQADPGNRLDHSPSQRPFPAAFSGQSVKEEAPQPHSTVHSASDSYDSGTTEEGVGGCADILPFDQVGTRSPFIKEESSPDTPVLISCRSIRKRKTRKDDDERSNESARNIKVKIESITSSPIGLSGFQNLIAQESLDLDDIGEKMNTPKKRRTASQALRSGNTSSAIKTQMDKPVASGEGGRDAQTKRWDAVLQPASPNKQILPHTSWKKPAPKRRRLEDQIMAAVILGEDGENYETRRRSTKAEIDGGNPREFFPSILHLDQRLNGLLEEASPKKEVLTPVRPLLFPSAVAQPHIKITAMKRHTGHSPSSKGQSNTFETANTTIFSSDVSKSDHKASTAKKRSFGTPINVRAFDHDSPDQGPLRARPLRRLGLAHFKINPNFNQGSDYAFADVVRGRELRKCLPGCTKPECCGDKFRKLAELTMDHEKQTISQETENEKLLQEYLGDNRGRLRNMAAKEKEELLVQAKARELANKASKHRHAYERQRSPPGFWRSDFPSTQEMITDREEAATRERGLVQQRYEEAMRPGGRWLFRDE